MTATTPSTALATIQPTSAEAERLALAGFLAGTVTRVTVLAEAMLQEPPICRWLYPSGRAGLAAHSWLFCCGGCATR